MKKILSVIALVFLTIITNAQDTSKVNWLSFDQVRKMFYSRPKSILIWIYDDNCDSCTLMLNKTFGNKEVADYINALFYPIKFKASTDDTVTFFNGQKFVHLPGQPFHQLAYSLMSDSVYFPALVVFDTKAHGRVFYGYQDRDHIFSILIYYAENVYVSTPFEDWQKIYFKAYPPGRQQIITRLFIHWIPLDQLEEKMKQQPRKIFVDVYDRYNVADNVMRLRVYNLPPIARYLNQHFYPVTVEARSSDTLIFNGKKYPPSDKYPYNTLAIDLLGGRMTFPTFLILDTNYKMLDMERVFLMPDVFYKIITYFGGDFYKSQSFKQYLKQHAAELDEKIKQIKKYYE